MSTVLRVRLTGDDAQLGRVAAGDVARMLLGIERAVARAAGHVIGRQVKSTGRRGRAIEETTRFRLLSIERGSVVGVLELPEQAANADVPSLGQLALESALATAAGEETEQVDVAEAFVRLVDDVGVGSRFQSLTLEEEGPAGRKMVTLDRPARDRLFEIVSAAPSARDDSLVGVLVEAASRAILRVYEPPAASASRSALRPSSPTGFRKACGGSRSSGEVSYDPKTLEARSVNLRSIVRAISW